MGFLLAALYIYVFLLSIILILRFLVKKEFRYDTIVTGRAVLSDSDRIVFEYDYEGKTYCARYGYRDIAFGSRIAHGDTRRLLISSKDPEDHYRYVLR